jgi:hypothetical protein
LIGLLLVKLLTNRHSAGRYVGDAIVAVVLIAFVVVTWHLAGRPRG